MGNCLPCCDDCEVSGLLSKQFILRLTSVKRIKISRIYELRKITGLSEILNWSLIKVVPDGCSNFDNCSGGWPCSDSMRLGRFGLNSYI